LLEDGKRNVWQEIKRIRGNKAVSSRMVDDLTDAGDIAHMFASIGIVSCTRAYRITLMKCRLFLMASTAH